jgi:hypothetical protein
MLVLRKNISEANGLLADGWVLVATYPQVRGSAHAHNQIPNDCYLNYVLGWSRTTGKPLPADIPEIGEDSVDS